MKRTLYSQSGQTVSLEHVVVFFLVLGSITAMSLYFQRAMQARVYDAEQVALRNVAANVTDARKTPVFREYEPYYAHVQSDVQRDSVEQSELLKSGFGTSGIYLRKVNERTEIKNTSEQFPPRDAN